jgi:Na+-driven multidrug efflux pump
MGLNQGMQPIAGYNFGARQYSRVKEVFWQTVKWATVVTTLCFVIGMFFPHIAAGIFTHDEELLNQAARSMRLLTAFFPIVGFQMISTNFFLSLGMVQKSVILSLSRQILFLLPLIYFLPLWLESDGVWISFPISDLLATLLSIYMLGRLFGKFNKLKDGDDSSILGSQL